MNFLQENNENHLTDDVSALRRSTSDILAISSLPSIWINQTPSQLSESLAETLFAILGLEFAFVRFKDRNIPLESIYTNNGFLTGQKLQSLSTALETFIETEKVTPALSEFLDGKNIQ